MTSRSEARVSRLASAALVYASHGWPVFPLIPKDKRPLTTDGFKSATSDRDAVLAWWDQWPEANIGLATGITFDVLDVDGEVGRNTLQMVLDSLGVSYRHTGPVAVTGKGWHYYFAPTGRGNRANIRGDAETKTNLDFRGLGGYVVAPPSLHPLGHRYTWNPTRAPREPLPTAPEWLDRLLGDDLPTAPRKPVLNRSPYLDLVEKGLIPKDQLPRQIQARRERRDILEVAAELGLQVRGRGRVWKTNCIYHNDPDPSLALYTDTNTFYCYGCEAHGDSYDLERKTKI